LVSSASLSRWRPWVQVPSSSPFFKDSNMAPPSKRLKSNCLNCGTELSYLECNSNGKFCNNSCRNTYARNIAVANGTAGPGQIRTWMLENVPYKCKICGLSKWRGNKISLHLDHINGNSRENTKQNVRWLCPNCHSQTETWGVKNVCSTHVHRLSSTKRAKILEAVANI